MSRGTTHRSVRVPDDVWTAALAATAAEGTTVSAVIVDALTLFTAQTDARRPRTTRTRTRKGSTP